MPTLSLFTESASGLRSSRPSSKFYVLYTLGGFRKQTEARLLATVDAVTSATATTSSFSSALALSYVDWGCVDRIPVTADSPEGLGVSLLEQLPVGDRHWGSAT
eukprot:RCo006431